MTAPRYADQLIQAFLADGQTELPDRAFDAVRRDIHRTRQRVVIGPWKEPRMSTLTRLAIAAAVVVALGVAWVNVAPIDRIGGPPTSAPTIGPTSTPELITGSNHRLEPATYRFDYRLAAGSDAAAGGPSIFVTIPSPGWTNYESFAVDKNYGGGVTAEEAGPSLVMWKITKKYVDPCGDAGVLFSPVPGPGIDELLVALADQTGLTAGPLTDVTVDGYAGKYVELTVATDVATCPNGFYPWVDKFIQGNNELLRVYALDLDGDRLTFFLRIPQRTTAVDRALLHQLVDSIDIAP